MKIKVHFSAFTTAAGETSKSAVNNCSWAEDRDFNAGEEKEFVVTILGTLILVSSILVVRNSLKSKATNFNCFIINWSICDNLSFIIKKGFTKK